MELGLVYGASAAGAEVGGSASAQAASVYAGLAAAVAASAPASAPVVAGTAMAAVPVAVPLAVGGAIGAAFVGSVFAFLEWAAKEEPERGDVAGTTSVRQVHICQQRLLPLSSFMRFECLQPFEIVVLRQIGAGHFGSVDLCQVLGEECAVKRCVTGTARLQRAAAAEIANMKRLVGHPCVVSLLGCYADAEQVLIAMEYMPG